MRIMAFLCILGCILAPAVSSVADERTAVVTLYEYKGTEVGTEVVGNITFVQERDGGPVKLTGTVSGLTNGTHGFHVHEKGDVGNGCDAVGGHFNPEKKTHGAPNDTERHVGDLGNIAAGVDKIATVNITDNVISLRGAHSIIGRALVVHSGTDDLGKGGKEDSNVTGNAGGKVACGVIGIRSPVTPWERGAATTILQSATIVLLSVFVVSTLM